MENQKSQTQQLILNYGLILGFLSIIFSVIRYAMGKHLEQDWTVSVFSFITMFAVIGYGIYLFKQANEGFLSIGEGLKIGVGIALVGGILSIIYTLIFVTYIEPDFANQLLIIQQEQILEKYPDFTDEQLEAAANMTKKFTTPGAMAGFAIMGSLFFGLIVSLIVALFLKKSKENPYSN
ncbi:MAG: DUF4199 domain-containing protein [Flavobacteriaceae bacterium]|jgi:hypothetical protein|nr:DUF4199 domain-containing protein [Flavobacteriaceae bacterium]